MTLLDKTLSQKMPLRATSVCLGQCSLLPQQSAMSEKIIAGQILILLGVLVTLANLSRENNGVKHGT